MSSLQSFLGAMGKSLGGFLLAPEFLWFLGLIPIVILLYLLKLRRTQVIIASTLLWMKSMQDLTANAPFQRLRRNLLLLLQVLVLLLIAFALARPFIKAQGTAGRNICLMLDRSASMQTLEGDKTRLDLAKEIATQMVDDMQRGDKTMLVTFAENSDVLCELTDDRSRLKDAIRDITAADTRTRLRDAFFVAHSLRLTVGDLHGVIISDGNIGDLDEIGPRVFGETRQIADRSTEARARGYDLSFIQVGETRKNAGIVAFNIREPGIGQPGERQSFVLVHNDDTEPLTTTVTLSFNEEVLAIEELVAEPGQDAELVFQHGELGTGILEAELDVEDALAADNSAWLTLRPTVKVKVLLVAEPDATAAYFLQRVLAPDPRVELSTIVPANYTKSADYDLTVFYGYSPETLPAGSLVFINSIPKIANLVSEGTLERPPVIAKDSEHPLMRFNLNPMNVGIDKALKLSLPAGARSVVSTTGFPLIADVSQGDQQITIIAFDIAESNWPLNLSFPLFFQNVLSWVPRASLSGELYVNAGRPITLMPRSEVASATVQLPDGRKEQVALDPLRPVFFSDTEQRGVYTAAYGEATEQIAVNVLDRTESSVAPSDALKIGRGEFAAEGGTVRQNHELWRWILAAGLALLSLEWWIFSRRAWI